MTMDPNEKLREIREYVLEIQDMVDRYMVIGIEAPAGALATAIDQLDASLSRGEFLPDAWLTCSVHFVDIRECVQHQH